MRHSAATSALLLISLAAAAAGLAGPQGSRTVVNSLRHLLPAAVEPGSWRVDGEPQTFSGRALFDYMDGGADIYFEYGFRQVTVQDYKDPGARTITIEVFELDSPENAYGLFTFKSGPEGEPLRIGDEGRLVDYFLNIRKGPFVLTLTGQDSSDETKAGLAALGRAAAARIPSAGAVPGIISLLPAAGRVVDSARYFKGRLGLFQSFPYFSSDVFAFGSGARADYAGSLTLLILEYASAAAAQARFAAAQGDFRKSGKFARVGEVAEILEAEDAKGRQVLVQAKDRRIFIVLGPKDGAAARRLLTSADESAASAAGPSPKR